MQFFSDIGTKHSWIKTISPFFFISSLSQYILPFCASYKLATHSPAFGAMVSKLLSQFFLAKPFPFSWTKFTWIFVCVSWHNYYPRIQTKRILFMSKWTLKPYRRVRGDIIFPTCVGMNRLELPPTWRFDHIPHTHGDVSAGDHLHPLMPGTQDDQIFGRLRDRCWLSSSLSSGKGTKTSEIMPRELCRIRSFIMPICSYTFLVQAHPISAYPRCYGQDRRIIK